MNIMLTNDDGYDAAGIKIMYKYLTDKGHCVLMVAPESQRSGFSQNITVGQAVTQKQIGNENIFALSGTPADCVLYTLKGMTGNSRPDLIISGINDGANIGMDVIYSGTVAAARQGAMLGVPSIALSYKWRNNGQNMNERLICYFLDNYFDRMYELAKDTDYFVNVNFPISSGDDFPEVRPAFISQKMSYQDEIVSFNAPNNTKYLWIKDSSDSAMRNSLPEYESDAYQLLVQHNITVSIVKVYPSCQKFNI